MNLKFAKHKSNYSGYLGNFGTNYSPILSVLSYGLGLQPYTTIYHYTIQTMPFQLFNGGPQIVLDRPTSSARTWTFLSQLK